MVLMMFRQILITSVFRSNATFTRSLRYAKFSASLYISPDPENNSTRAQSQPRIFSVFGNYILLWLVSANLTSKLLFRNQPFAPADRRSAHDILKEGGGEYRLPEHHDGPELGLASIRRTLVNSWREVDKTTREN